MEHHEVFVPVPVERLRAALSDPERVARAVPGLQQEAGTAPVAGRLKVRVAGRTITYRGALRVIGQDDGSYAIEGDATEARGSGSAKLALSVRLAPAEGGTAVTFGGTATADGRIAELADDAVSAAAARLLTRFAEGLGESVGAEGEQGAGESVGAEGEQGAEAAPDADVPPTSLDAYLEDDLVAEDVAGEGFVDEVHEVDDVHEVDEGEPPAEAAHARRTMIGRSAEEVDHAPPRGRYAPVPAPESVVTGPTLRWAAPAAALALASAVVVVRVLRRRR